MVLALSRCVAETAGDGLRGAGDDRRDAGEDALHALGRAGRADRTDRTAGVVKDGRAAGGGAELAALAGPAAAVHVGEFGLEHAPAGDRAGRVGGERDAPQDGSPLGIGQRGQAGLADRRAVQRPARPDLGADADGLGPALPVDEDHLAGVALPPGQRALSLTYAARPA